jgi:hypothetical protein
MQFGTRKADAPEQSGNYLRNFQKGETLVRFTQEVDDWWLFYEHYNSAGRSFPCTEDRNTCPGCTSHDEKVSDRKRKYASQLLLVKKGVVLPYRLPVTLADRMTVRSERNGGTILNRDYVVLKSGTGFDTEYDVDQEDKYPVDLDELKKKVTIDIQVALQDSFKENSPEGVSKAPRADRSSIKSEEETGRVKTSSPGEDDVPPTEPQGQSDEAAGDDVDLTEAQVRRMDKASLHALCDKAGISYDEEDTRSELADKLIAKFGE